MRLALHACCGPCLLEPYDDLVEAADEIVVVYFNPNIHPAGEYRRRLQTLREHADAAGIDVVELEYDAGEWLHSAGAHARDRAARCRACYALRLGEVAKWAAANGFEAIATTLTVSPYQDAGAITEAGRAAAAAAGIRYLERDYRDRYPDATRRSRDAGMYRQNYCGCVMSDLEASAERAARRAVRRARR